jgi:aerobic C4-dicarboxylate transport protein
MLVFGIDKFMSECRALTNMIGNSVAAIVVAKWEGQLDVEQARRVLNPPKAPAANPDERPLPEPIAA